MTWIAVSDRDDRRLSLRGLGADKQPAPVMADTPDTLLTRGTILLETRASDTERPQALFGFAATEPWLRSLQFQTIPGVGVTLTHVQGDHITRAEICHDLTSRADVLRITYSWDTIARWGHLTLERPEAGQTAMAKVADPRPLTLRDARDLMLGRDTHFCGPDIIYAALSDDVEPVGPMPSLLPSTPIATPWGYKAASTLHRGDTVTTLTSGVAPVLHRLTRTVPARGSYQPIRVRAPYFGLAQDIIVAPEQCLLIDGPEVEYLFGKEAVLVPARHLVNGFTALPEPCGPTIRYTQLLLPGHETMVAAGLPLESLYVGRIRRDRAALEQSLLRALDRAGLPEHGRRAHPVLQWYEAIHLARQRAA